MTDEELKLLEDQLAVAETRESKLDAWLLWLPHMTRCIASLNRKLRALEEQLERLSADIATLTKLVSALHPLEVQSATPQKTEGKTVVTTEDPRITRLKIMLAFAQRNWQSVAILVILAKALGFLDGLTLKSLLDFLH